MAENVTIYVAGDVVVVGALANSQRRAANLMRRKRR